MQERDKILAANRKSGAGRLSSRIDEKEATTNTGGGGAGGKSLPRATGTIVPS